MTTVAISMHDKFRADVKDFCFEANEAQQLLKFRPIKLQAEELALFSAKTLRTEEVFKKAFPLKATHRLAGDDMLVLLVDADLHDDEDDEYFFVSNLYYESTAKEYPGVGVLSMHYLKKTSTFRRETTSEWGTITESKKRDLLWLLLFGLITHMWTRLNCHQDSQRGCTMDYCQSPPIILRLLELGFPFCERCLTTLKNSDEGTALVALSKYLAERRHREFGHVSDPKLRGVLAADYEELQAAFRAKCWKSVIVLAGAVMEGLLLDKLKLNQGLAVAAIKAPKNNKTDLDRWRLTDLISVATELKIISSTVDKYTESLRDFRNLIHPVRQAQSGLQPGQAEAQIAMTVLDIVRKC